MTLFGVNKGLVSSQTPLLRHLKELCFFKWVAGRGDSLLEERALYKSRSNLEVVLATIPEVFFSIVATSIVATALVTATLIVDALLVVTLIATDPIGV